MICNEEKELEKFRKRKIWYSHTCKKCYAAQYATGKPNKGRFKKGNVPINPFKKGHIPWTKGKFFSESRSSKKYRLWRESVLKRDEHKCTKCGSKENLHCHHIIPWKKNIELRLSVDNGIALCEVCHGRDDREQKKNSGIRTRFKKGHKLSEKSIEKLKNSLKGRISCEKWKKGLTPWNKGIPMSDEAKQKLKNSLKGKVPWNKGLKKST